MHTCMYPTSLADCAVHAQVHTGILLRTVLRLRQTVCMHAYIRTHICAHVCMVYKLHEAVYAPNDTFVLPITQNKTTSNIHLHMHIHIHVHIHTQIAPDGLCAKGYYCPPRSSNNRQYPCVAGTYSDVTNLTSQDECKLCPEGYFCMSGCAEPVGCPPGTFSKRRGTQSAGLASTTGNTEEMFLKSYFPKCESCPAGFKCLQTAMTVPEPCGVGRYAFSSPIRTSMCVCVRVTNVSRLQ